MQLEQVYDGKHLPGYHYEPDLLMVGLISRSEPEDPEKVTWLYLPASREQINHTILRSGITHPDDMRFRFGESSFPEEVDAALDFEWDSIYELNDMALAIHTPSQKDRVKLGAAVAMAEPVSAVQIRHLAENLDLFEFAPVAHTPAEYGKYMIQESEHYEYAPNLEEFYDYEKDGLQHMDREYGVFTDRGYISYQKQ